MDSADQFARKKKKDLVAIASLFGILTEEKANRLTKPELIEILLEQEKSAGEITHVPEQSNPVESVEPEPALVENNENVTPLLEPAAAPHRTVASRRRPALAKEEQSVPAVAVTTEHAPIESVVLAEAAVPVEAAAEATEDQTPKPAGKKSSRSGRKTSRETTADNLTSSESSPESPSASVTLRESEAETLPVLNPSSDVQDKKPDTESAPESGSEAVFVPDSETKIPAATDTATPAPRSAEGQPRQKRRHSVIIKPKDELPAEPDELAAPTEISAEAVTETPAETTAAGDAQEGENAHHRILRAKEAPPELYYGVLEIMSEGYGFLRRENYLQGQNDVYVPVQYIRRFGLRPGDYVVGPCRPKRDSDRYQALQYIKEVNGLPPEKMIRRPNFDRLTPIYPDERYVLETSKTELSTRIIDLVAPIGKGQRGMIVSPPKAGKTILLQKIANSISVNNPDSKLIVLLIDERPEEVTDMQRSINGEVVYSTFDKTPENHVRITELVLERAMRLVELGQDVVILLDSITRLSRAYNLTINPTGRTLSGGLDPGALYGPKRFFGAARNIENGGSLTIIATSLIETGSRMDEVIFEEFKGTGNMEVYLDRKLSEKRIFPAIDINRSGTRREELLLTSIELDSVWTIRKAFGQLDTAAVTEMIISLLLKTAHNSQFVQSVNVSFNDKAVFEAMRGTRPGGNNGTGVSGK